VWGVVAVLLRLLTVVIVSHLLRARRGMFEAGQLLREEEAHAQFHSQPKPGRGRIMMMRLKRFLTVIGLLLALPAVAQTAALTKPPSPTAAILAAETNQLVDINSASLAELDKLPGVGPARAKAIIANRPYSGKDNLVQRKIIPVNVYNQIRDKIIARQK
jgi:DNA uptake protein ComE-like DNA-binding protein